MTSILPSDDPSNSATVSRARLASAWIARSGSSGPYQAGLSQPPYSRIWAPSARCSASSGRRFSGLRFWPRRRHLGGPPELGVDNVDLHGVHEARRNLQLRRRVRDIGDAALAQHDVEVELAGQALVEPEGEIVERDRFGIEIVRPH